MASPVTWEVPPRDSTFDVRSRLKNAPEKHAEALLEVYELLQGLHDRGVLDALRGALGASGQILASAVEAARTPESIRATRNLLLLSRFLGSIEPERLKELLQATRQSDKPVGLWKRFRNSLRGLATIMGFLESFGRVQI